LLNAPYCKRKNAWQICAWGITTDCGAICLYF
jgi:hypothetical protein